MQWLIEKDEQWSMKKINIEQYKNQCELLCIDARR